MPELYESFYAITVERLYPHPWLRALLARDERELLTRGARALERESALAARTRRSRRT